MFECGLEELRDLMGIVAEVCIEIEEVGVAVVDGVAEASEDGGSEPEFAVALEEVVVGMELGLFGHPGSGSIGGTIIDDEEIGRGCDGLELLKEGREGESFVVGAKEDQSAGRGELGRGHGDGGRGLRGIGLLGEEVEDSHGHGEDAGGEGGFEIGVEFWGVEAGWLYSELLKALETMGCDDAEAVHHDWDAGETILAEVFTAHEGIDFEDIFRAESLVEGGLQAAGEGSVVFEGGGAIGEGDRGFGRVPGEGDPFRAAGDGIEELLSDVG